MSTGMRKWMEKDCPDIPSLPAEVSIDREELRQLRDELAQCKNERDDLRAKIEEMEKQEPVAWTTRRALELVGRGTLGFHACGGNLWGEKGAPLYALPGAQTQGEEK